MNDSADQRLFLAWKELRPIVHSAQDAVRILNCYVKETSPGVWTGPARLEPDAERRLGDCMARLESSLSPERVAPVLDGLEPLLQLVHPITGEPAESELGEKLDSLREAVSGFVDDMRRDSAEGSLEIRTCGRFLRLRTIVQWLALWDEAFSSSRKLDCIQCGRRLGSYELEYGSGECSGCRSRKGKVEDLDVAICATADTPTRIKQWPGIRHLLKERFPNETTDADLWLRCKGCLQTEGIGPNDYLAWPLEKLTDWLRRSEVDRESTAQPFFRRTLSIKYDPQPIQQYAEATQENWARMENLIAAIYQDVFSDWFREAYAKALCLNEQNALIATLNRGGQAWTELTGLPELSPYDFGPWRAAAIRAGYSAADFTRFPLEDLADGIKAWAIARRAEAHLLPTAHTAPALPTADRKKKGRGRPSGANVKRDQQIYEAKVTGQYRTRADLADALGITARDVRLALDRHRKRHPSPRKKRKR